MSQILKKTVWSDEDFDAMGWHDATVHGMAILPDSLELVLDIDYILRWVDPVPPSRHYSFWVSPATLAFQGVRDLESEIGLRQREPPTVLNLLRLDPQPAPSGEATDWRWGIDLDQGRVGFRAQGFKQFFRRPPAHLDSQAIGPDRRGGVSFVRQWDAAAV